MSTLKDLYNGEIIPCESNNTNNAKTELILSLRQKEEKLVSLLSDSQKEVFEEYRDAFNELEYVLRSDNFAEGFKLGAKIMLEATQ